VFLSPAWPPGTIAATDFLGAANEHAAPPSLAAAHAQLVFSLTGT
jgi:hypothetical protein